MNSIICRRLSLGCFLLLLATGAGAAETNPPIPLWPAALTTSTNQLPAERDTTRPGQELIAGKSIIRLGHVSVPTLTVYRPPADKDTGTAVVVCPGGGYTILAWDLEGTEVCQWLNSIGVTGVLLKYRVPKHDGQPLQDAQRALGLVRSRAREFGIDPRRIGMLGFSAGAHLAAQLSAHSAPRTYPAVDDADQAGCRPDFQLLIYPGGLIHKDDPGTLVPEVAVSTNTPPTFLAMAEDDPTGIENVTSYALALKPLHVPFELHVYPTGGHGYGLRRTKALATTWPDRAADWMKSRGLLELP